VKGRSTVVRLGVEFVVIVAGVLVALAVDEWHSGLDDARSRYELLSAVEADLKADSLELADVLPLEGRLRDLYLYLDSLVTGPSLEPDSSRVREALDGIVYIWVPVVNRAAFDRMVASGALSLLEPELQQALHEYYGQRARTARVVEEERAAVQRTDLPSAVLRSAVFSRLMEQLVVGADDLTRLTWVNENPLAVLQGWRLDPEPISDFLRRRAINSAVAVDLLSRDFRTMTIPLLAEVQAHLADG